MKLTLIENTILPIYKDNNEEMLVDARELHAFLNVESKFADWIKRRLEESGLTENKDYVRISQKRETSTGFTRAYEYALTFETAKHLALMERNAKGREVRQYFIDFEKEARKALFHRDLEKEKIIEAFIRELGPLATPFPDSFYEALHPLMGWIYRGRNKQPGYIGKLTNRLIYTKLAPGVYEAIDRRNPYRSEKRRRKYLMSRLLTDEIGKAALRRQIDFVTQMAQLVGSIDELERIVERNYQNQFGGARQLSFLKVRYELATL